MTNAANAANAILELEKEFRETDTTTKDVFMEAFVRTCRKNGGTPFLSMPDRMEMKLKDNSTYPLIVHAATFSSAKGEVAFAAALFEEESGEFAGLHSGSAAWPKVIDQLVRTLHAGVTQALAAHKGVSH